MYPELFRIGPLAVGSYGVMLALAFIAGILIATKFAEKREIDRNEVSNLAIISIISAIIGSRLLYVVTHLDEFSGRWEYTFLPIQPDGSIGLSGLIFLGGFIAAVLTGIIYVKYKQLPVWKIADSMAPALAFGLFLGRIGCFLNGCCFGKACLLPWAVKYPSYSAANYIMGGAHLHPTQLYSSAYSLLIFFILLRFDKKDMYPGFLTGLFLLLYGISRFTVDFFRYYESQMFIIAGLDLNQIISLFMIFFGLIILKMNKPAGEKLA